METQKIIPVITTRVFRETKAFYTEHFGASVIAESSRYLGLNLGRKGGPELGFMSAQSEETPSFQGAGLMCCLQVADVDAEYERLRVQAVPIEQEPRDEPWGDRSMIVRDPNGLALYIFQLIPRDEAYKQFFKE